MDILRPRFSHYEYLIFQCKYIFKRREENEAFIANECLGWNNLVRIMMDSRDGIDNQMFNPALMGRIGQEDRRILENYSRELNEKHRTLRLFSQSVLLQHYPHIIQMNEIERYAETPSFITKRDLIEKAKDIIEQSRAQHITQYITSLPAYAEMQQIMRDKNIKFFLFEISYIDEENPYAIPLVAYDDFLYSDGGNVSSDFYQVYAPTRGLDESLYTLCFINEEREIRVVTEETNRRNEANINIMNQYTPNNMNRPDRNVGADYSQDEEFHERFDALIEEIQNARLIDQGTEIFQALQMRMRQTNALCVIGNDSPAGIIFSYAVIRNDEPLLEQLQGMIDEQEDENNVVFFNHTMIPNDLEQDIESIIRTRYEHNIEFIIQQTDATENGEENQIILDELLRMNVNQLLNGIVLDLLHNFTLMNNVENRMRELNVVLVYATFDPVSEIVQFAGAIPHTAGLSVQDHLEIFYASHQDILNYYIILNPFLVQEQIVEGDVEIRGIEIEIAQRNEDYITHIRAQLELENENEVPNNEIDEELANEVHTLSAQIMNNPLWNNIKSVLYQDESEIGKYSIEKEPELNDYNYDLPYSAQENMISTPIKIILKKMVDLSERSTTYKRNRKDEISQCFTRFTIFIGPDGQELIKIVFDYLFYLDIPELYAKYVSRLVQSILQAYAFTFHENGNMHNINGNQPFRNLGISCVNGRLERIFTVAIEILTQLPDGGFLEKEITEEARDKLNELKGLLPVMLSEHEISQKFYEWLDLYDDKQDPLAGEVITNVILDAKNYIMTELRRDGVSLYEHDIQMIDSVLNKNFPNTIQPFQTNRKEMFGMFGGKRRAKRTKKNKNKKIIRKHKTRSKRHRNTKVKK